MVFHYINEGVKPLRVAFAQANAELRAAVEKLHSLRNRLAVSLSLSLQRTDVIFAQFLMYLLY